jgi:hypothetical protein
MQKNWVKAPDKEQEKWNFRWPIKRKRQQQYTGQEQN